MKCGSRQRNAARGSEGIRCKKLHALSSPRSVFDARLLRPPQCCVACLNRRNQCQSLKFRYVLTAFANW